MFKRWKEVYMPCLQTQYYLHWGKRATQTHTHDTSALQYGLHSRDTINRLFDQHIPDQHIPKHTLKHERIEQIERIDGAKKWNEITVVT